MHLYLVRHGQSYINLRDWEDGNLDKGLTDLGQRQAAALATWLHANIPQIDALYCSSMQRTRETAEPLAAIYGLPIQYDDYIREIGNNRTDHSPWPNDGLPKQYADFWGTERPFESITPIVEQGETLMHFRARVGMFIERLVKTYEDQTVVVVCHGGVIASMFSHVFNLGPWIRCDVFTSNTGISYLRYTGYTHRETWRLHFHNSTAHLVKSDVS